MQLTRTLMFVPANRPNMVQRAHQTPADVIVLDLEDAVPPAEKAAARATVRASIESLHAAGKTVHARVNNIETKLTRDDLAAVVGPGLHAILYPKPQSAQEIRDLDVLIREQEYHKEGVKPGDIALIPMIETALAVLRCEDIARASSRIFGLASGGEDYCANLGIPRTREGRELEYLRRAIIHVCAAYGLRPLDGIYAPLGDEEGLRADAAYARSIGMKGKYIVHPEQAMPVNDVFSPTPEEVAAARQLVAEFEAGVAAGHGTVRIAGQMVDVPVANRARELIAYAEAIAARS
jgi:citrate lyase subunit beta/citryl-CoA lyase